MALHILLGACTIYIFRIGCLNQLCVCVCTVHIVRVQLNYIIFSFRPHSICDERYIYIYNFVDIVVAVNVEKAACCEPIFVIYICHKMLWSLVLSWIWHIRKYTEEEGRERDRIDDHGESKWFVSKQINGNQIKLRIHHITVIAIWNHQILFRS